MKTYATFPLVNNVIRHVLPIQNDNVTRKNLITCNMPCVAYINNNEKRICNVSRS
jgi:hypothetical protein